MSAKAAEMRLLWSLSACEKPKRGGRTIINDDVKRTSGLLLNYLVQEDKVGLISNIKASCSAHGKRRCKHSALWLGSPVASNNKISSYFACVRYCGRTADGALTSSHRFYAPLPFLCALFIELDIGNVGVWDILSPQLRSR